MSQSSLGRMPSVLPAEALTQQCPLEWVKERNFNTEQTSAVLVRSFALLRAPSEPAIRLFVTGDAGTGKSVVMRTFSSYSAQCPDWPHSPSPQSRTNHNSYGFDTGATIASMFGFGRGKVSNEDEEDADAITVSQHRLVDPNATQARLESAAIIDVDEVSMVGHCTLSRMHETLSTRWISNGTAVRQPRDVLHR